MNDENNSASMNAASTQVQPQPMLSPQPDSFASTKRRYAAIGIIIIALVLITTLVLYSIHLAPFNKTSTTSTVQATTTIKAVNISNSTSNIQNFDKFLSGFSLPVSSIYKVFQPSLFRTSECNYTGYVKWYIENGFPSNSSIAVNYSKLNQSVPFAWYVMVGASSNTAAYLSALKANSGFCSATAYNVSIHSSFSSAKVPFNSGEGYIVGFNNFTAEADSITQTYYIGPKPNVAWYFTTAIYNGTIIKVGAWGFYGNVSESALANFTNLTISSYILYSRNK